MLSPTPRRFVGIDLAWASRNRTGLAVVDDSGRLLASAAVRSDDEIDAWLAELAPAPTVVGVDAPLVVPNATGSRPAERLIGSAFGRFGASAYPSNRSIPWFDPPRAELLAARHGWSVDPGRATDRGVPVCLEVYPHAAMIGLFSLPRRILYKKGPDRRAGFLQLVAHFETIRELRLDESPRWAEIVRLVETPARGDLTRIEDEVDAILCAHVAWLWHHRREALQVFGTLAEGYVVAPPPPER